MTKQQFWHLMARFKTESAGDRERFFSLTDEYLDTLPAKEVALFRAYLGAYINEMSECIWADMACKVINGYISDDASLHFNLWLVTQGERVVLDALRDPDSLADLPALPFGSAAFEMLMYVGFRAENYDVSAESTLIAAEVAGDILFKNGDRYGRYNSFAEAMLDIRNALPRLAQRAEEAHFQWENRF